MKKKDFILIILLLAIAAAGMFAVKALQSGEGARVVIRVDGREYGSYPLSEDRTVPIDNDFGHNLVVIENGSVQVEEADCPDLICVKHAPVSRDHETIICLPHKLVVEVQGGRQADIDAAAQ